MNTQFPADWLRKILSIAAIVSASTLLVIPVEAKNCQAKAEMRAESMRMQDESTAMKPSIVEIASKNDSFKTLTAALQAAGLVETLAEKGPFTVFAPTDEAFAALPEGTVETLLKPENKDKLIKVLTYHVIAGAVKSGELTDGNVTTLEGNPVIIKLDGGKVMVNEAKVTTADIVASNGVIHIIDKVILPPDM
ncbi:MAG: fasciclin domain-containing protein [Oscillatoriaceae bacterium SKW80]|nr:fasciclin domain-containing protein [Oscillatoriaceae bacterium SKYG93]MCX8119408.1 fasciclin domain-containing protein [Oscillatoriaceae bacterium SKW80]MDW8454875.1 fasciclin domain-containing protein [Oscillatoriaceae cyanobacterium SKYGB_i_bin93]HIK28346.1 fasciclin domain-containing protein [Oscillatoriaceae cyanobacterium M7585_C2015_266]